MTLPWCPRIRELRLQGLGWKRIAVALTAERIPTPRVAARRRKRGYVADPMPAWNDSQVQRIARRTFGGPLAGVLPTDDAPVALNGFSSPAGGASSGGWSRAKYLASVKARRRVQARLDAVLAPRIEALRARGLTWKLVARNLTAECIPTPRAAACGRTLGDGLGPLPEWNQGKARQAAWRIFNGHPPAKRKPDF